MPRGCCYHGFNIPVPHVHRWSRQQAVDFMVENTAMSLHNVNTEIDRYIIWQGQVGTYIVEQTVFIIGYSYS